MKRFILAGLFITAAALSALSAAKVVTPGFSPSDSRIDLSRESDTGILGPAWDIRPVPKWRGVVQVFDRGNPAVIPIELPSADSWMFRFKLLFLKPDAKVRVSFNGELLGTWEPKHAGEAEKFQVLLPSKLVRAGINQIEFAPAGPSASVIYEQIRLLNFRSKLWKHNLYLIPASKERPSGSSLSSLFGIFAVAVIAGLILWVLTAGLVSVIGGWPFPSLFIKQSIGWVLIAAVAPVVGNLQMVSPYQFTGTALGYWSMIGLLWILVQLPLFLAALLRRFGRIILSGSRLIDVYGPDGLNTLQRIGRLTLWFLGVLAKFIVHLIGRLIRLIVWIVRWVWRNQHPFGYLKIAAVFLAAALIGGFFKWNDFHDAMSHAAGVCVLISMIKEALRSLKGDAANPAARSA